MPVVAADHSPTNATVVLAGTSNVGVFDRVLDPVEAEFQVRALRAYAGAPPDTSEAPVDPGLAMNLQGDMDQRARIASEDARRREREQQQAAVLCA